MAKMRLDKFLSNMGCGSRKEVRAFVKKGAVTVDGAKVSDFDMKIETGANRICLFDEEITFREHIYLLMNKPEGVITATDDPSNRHTTVIDLLSDEYACFGLFPVGRLDKDTVGLLILTDDGIFAHKTLAPKNRVPKVYYAVIEGCVSQNAINSFKNSVVLDDGYVCAPAELEISASNAEKSEVLVTLTEGKFHQVKRMFAAIGKRVLYLRRIGFGGIKLDESLAEGECRELTECEHEKIQEYL
jgi:16S rRNA pseudouridine516 synthase